MNKMQKTPRPIHEIVAEISKSTLKKHTLRYVFVEGVDDVAIYSEIARKKDLKTKLTFEQQGGRIQLLKLYETIKANSAVLNRTLFFADQDTYIFDAVPTEYMGINFTKGYSIENDLFEDGYEFLMGDLSSTEKIRFENLVDSVSEWYAYEIEKVISGNSKDSKIAINGLNKNTINEGSSVLSASFLVQRAFVQPNKTLHQRIKNDYKNLLRGKILFELLLCISFDREKGIHHKNRETFWNNSIIMGLQNSRSNCSRISTVFQNNINQ